MADAPDGNKDQPPVLPDVPKPPSVAVRNRRSEELAVELGQRRRAASEARAAQGTSSTPVRPLRYSARLATRSTTVATTSKDDVPRPQLGRMRSRAPKLQRLAESDTHSSPNAG